MLDKFDRDGMTCLIKCMVTILVSSLVNDLSTELKSSVYTRVDELIQIIYPIAKATQSNSYAQVLAGLPTENQPQHEPAIDVPTIISPVRPQQIAIESRSSDQPNFPPTTEPSATQEEMTDAAGKRHFSL